MRILTLLFPFLFLTTTLVAQQAETKSSLGIKSGITTYYGELNDQFFPATQELRNFGDNLDYLSWGIDFEKYFGNSWGIGIEYTNVEFSASDRRLNWDGSLDLNAPNFGRALNVNTSINDFTLYGIWSANDGKLFNERSFFSPYIKLGVGLTRFIPSGNLLDSEGRQYNYQPDGTVSVSDGDNQLVTELDDTYETSLRELETNNYSYNTRTFNVSGGIGFNFRFGQHFSLQLQSMLRLTNSDNLDDVGGAFKTDPSNSFAFYASNPGRTTNSVRGEEGNDAYAFHSLTARFYFGDRVDEFKAPVIFLGELPLQDTSAREIGLFEFEELMPLTPLFVEIEKVEVATMRPTQVLDFPTISDRPADPQWIDSDGGRNVPSIESEVPVDYNRTLDYSGDSEIVEYSRFSESPINTAKADTADTFSTPPKRIVSTYPQWAREQSLLGDSLQRASVNLQRQLDQLRLATPIENPKVDSLDDLIARRDSRIDSLEKQVSRIAVQVADTSKLIATQTDTVILQQTDSAELRRLQAELQQLKADRISDAQYRSTLRQRDEDLRRAALERDKMEIERLRDLDRANTRLEQREFRETRRLNNAEIRQTSAELAGQQRLLDEQRDMRRELSALAAQVAALQADKAIRSTGDTSVQQIPQQEVIVQKADPELTGELKGLREELSALRQALATKPITPTSSPAPSPAPVLKPAEPQVIYVPAAPQPAAQLPEDRRAEILEELRKYDVTRIFFASNVSSVNSQGRNQLASVVDLARRYPEYVVIRLEGFADRNGDQKANQLLSERRVNSVRQALEQMGIPPTQIRFSARGEDFESEDLAFGRRVEVRLSLR